MLWRARRWRHLLGLIDQLPATSRLQAAVLDDPEYAEAVVAAENADENDQPAWAPSVTEWPVQALILAEVRDRLGEVANAVAALGGGKPQRLKPFPRPETEIHRARRRAEQTNYLQGLAVFSPHALNN